MAKTSGSGAVDLKLSLLAGLLAGATPNEAKYVMRTVTGNLRLGIADMTVLDALAIAYGGGKEAREHIERAYNICSDLGRVAKTVVELGLEGVKNFQVSINEPIRPMLAERLSSPEEILDKLGGKCAAEYKYDGERLQAHKQDNEVRLYSRRLENISVNIPMQLTCSRLILRRKKPYWNANALLSMWILANCDHFRSSCTEDANMRLGKRLRIILSRCLCLKCFMLTGKI